MTESELSEIIDNIRKALGAADNETTLMAAQTVMRDLSRHRLKIAAATKRLQDGLKYHEHDGHDMPKQVARDALIALGVPLSQQV